MKTKKSIVVTIGLLIGFVIGLMVGITLTNPGLSLMEAAGTIGKVDKYRNVRVTEKDIELRNELLADESLREAYKNYLMYEYAFNVKMADDIQFSIAAADDVSGFKSANARVLQRLEDYALFLDNARLQILEAIGTLDNLSGGDQVAVRSVLNNAGNALAQTVYRSTVLFDFMNGVELFINHSGEAEYPRLAKAHDLLFANLLNACIVNENRTVLEHLLAKELLTEGEDLALKKEVLQTAYIVDAEQLPIRWDAEKLQDNILQSHILFVQFLDFEQLRTGFTDSESLRGIIWTDSEQLGTGFTLDSEQLQGSVLYDVEGLNSIISSKEQLNRIVTY